MVYVSPDKLRILNNGQCILPRTIRIVISVTQGLCSSVAVTFNTPLLLGGPASVRSFFELHRIILTKHAQVTWCWILGSVMCLALGASIAEIVSAFPTSGGL
jgi:amino acid transporter